MPPAQLMKKYAYPRSTPQTMCIYKHETQIIEKNKYIKADTQRKVYQLEMVKKITANRTKKKKCKPQKTRKTTREQIKLKKSEEVKKMTTNSKL